MGCCHSLPANYNGHQNNGEDVSSRGGGGESPLTNFSFSDLLTATNSFSPENIISENGHETSDIVYKGLLQNRGFIAVKRFKNTAWPDRDQFVDEAKRVGTIRHERIVTLIGYCCDGNERILVAEFMSNDTLAKRLFHLETQNMEWEMRLKVAYCVAQALDYCSTSGFTSYNNLSAYTVLFDEAGDASLSCFGLMKENNINDNQSTNGSVNPESVIYRFGTILVNLISGKQIPPSHAPEMIHGKNVTDLMDSNLEGNFSIEEATIVFKLATECLQYENRENLNTNELVATLEALRNRTQVPSYSELEMHNEESCTQLSPFAEACTRMDLAAIHEILVKKEYEDDKEVIEFSFEEWTQDMIDLQEVRIRGDQAFKEQNFETAIECYSQFTGARRTVYPSVYARRSLSYLFCNHLERALLDGMHAQEVFPDWPTAFYLQSVALAKLNMNTDSVDVLKEATLLEAKKQLQ